MQGLAELAGVPYVGANVFAPRAAMDRDAAKCLLRDAGLPIVRFRAVTEADAPSFAGLVAELGRLLVRPPLSANLTRMRQWEIYLNGEVIVRWAGELIMWWIYGTLTASFLYARGAPNVWSDYVFGWTCIAVFVAACVLGSLALAMLKLLFIAFRHRYRAARLSRRPTCWSLRR